MFRKGEIFLATYRIKCLLGSGVSAQVWLAESLEKPTQRVAIKIANTRLPIRGYRELNRYLAHEGDLLREYPLSGVPRYLQSGTWKERYYIVMEYFPGITLNQRMQRKPQRTLDEALAFFLPLLETVAALHKRGIVHRDVKPANVICIPRRGQATGVAVVDFTISWHADRGLMTGPGQGCDGYSSLEQLRGDKPVALHDLFALAVTFYELLSGNFHPSGAKFDQAVSTWWFQNKSIVPLAHIRPELPDPLIAVVHRALDLKPVRRFQSADELLVAIQAASTP